MDADEVAEPRTTSDALERCLAELQCGDHRGLNGRLSRLSEADHPKEERA